MKDPIDLEAQLFAGVEKAGLSPEMEAVVKTSIRSWIAETVEKDKPFEVIKACLRILNEDIVVLKERDRTQARDIEALRKRVLELEKE